MRSERSIKPIAIVGVIIVAVLLGVGIVILGLSFSHHNDAGPAGPKKSTALPMVSKDQLEQSLSQQLTNPGQAAPTVICEHGLIGTVGNNTRCDVNSADNAFQPIVTVTSVDDANVKFDLAPAVSKPQLEAAVAKMVKQESQAAPDSVLCDTGLEGKEGFVATCHVTAGGFTSVRHVEVSQVQGLSMHYGLAPALPKSGAEKALTSQLRQIGKSPDTTTCAGDLEGKIDSTLRCTVTFGSHSQDYILTVTNNQNGAITFKYTPA